MTARVGSRKYGEKIAALGAAEFGAILALMARRKHAFGGLSMSDAELMAAALLGLEHQRFGD
jgi:hypothetical protein